MALLLLELPEEVLHVVWTHVRDRVTARQLQGVNKDVARLAAPQRRLLDLRETLKAELLRRGMRRSGGPLRELHRHFVQDRDGDCRGRVSNFRCACPREDDADWSALAGIEWPAMTCKFEKRAHYLDKADTMTWMLDHLEQKHPRFALANLGWDQWPRYMGWEE